MLTYANVQLLAAECVAFADLHAKDRDDVIDLCLSAGLLRGLAQGGEPLNSMTMAVACMDAKALLDSARKRVKVYD